MAKWRLSWPSLLPLPLSLPLSTLLSSRAITHIFYDIALLPSLSPLSLARLALFTVRRKKRFRPVAAAAATAAAAAASPLSPLMPHQPPHQDTERGRQRSYVSVCACGRCAGALVSFQTAELPGLAVITTKWSDSLLQHFPLRATCDATILSSGQRMIAPEATVTVSWEDGGEEMRRSGRDSTLVKNE